MDHASRAGRDSGTAPRESERRQDGWPGGLLAASIYAALTVAMTWPLAVTFVDHVPAGNNDLWQNLWNFHAWAEALAQWRSPYTTTALFQTSADPLEVSLAFHTHSEFNVLTAAPLTRILGVAAAYNACLLLGFFLAALGAFVLALELGASRGGAFVAGIVFAFFPQHVEQSFEHINLASYQAMPFFAYSLLRLLRLGGLGNAALCGVTFAWNALYSWHSGLMIVPLGVILFAASIVRPPRPRLRLVRDVAVAALLTTAILLPFLWPKLVEIASGARYFIKPPVNKGVDLAFLFIPPAYHSLWGSLASPLYRSLQSYGSVGFTCYLGWTPLALALFALCASKRRPALDADGVGSPHRPPVRLWSVLFLGYALLALGAELLCAGRTFAIPLPFSLLRDVPLAGSLRVANRFIVPAMLPLAMLAAFGTRALLSRPCCACRPRLATCLIASIVAVDFAFAPLSMRPLPRPPWTQVLAESDRGLVLNVPGGYRARGAEDLYLQTLHGRPIVGGYTSCVLPEVAERVHDLPFLQLIFEGRPKVGPEIIERELPRVLDELDVATVVVHRQRVRELLNERRAQASDQERRLYNPEKGIPAATLHAIEKELVARCGRPFYSDTDVTLYRVSRDAAPAGN